ncbi:hypothetical protein [uncultured Devosia sp.]|uniref:hypothetical protein n=1 Tax=uncultured Devosia sp. TaxID=211434 RepID=UPI0026337D61|nr:hypothetical protein [uncultured Devosia sp.]
MVWELLAVWAIVAAAIVWFVRDERRAQLEKLKERARRYATGPAWRHHVEPAHAAPMPTPQPVTERKAQELTAIQRKFLEEVRRQGL